MIIETTTIETNAGVTVTFDFLLAGKALFTVANGKGEHLTFKVNKAKQGDKYFVSLLTGPQNTSDYTYMGLWTPGKPVYYGGKTTFTADSRPAKVFAWALKAVQGLVTVPEGYSIQHEGRCGKCFKVLTDPVSIKTGFGPHCRKD